MASDLFKPNYPPGTRAQPGRIFWLVVHLKKPPPLPASSDLKPERVKLSANIFVDLYDSGIKVTLAEKAINVTMQGLAFKLHCTDKVERVGNTISEF